jgi:hypothetical protein
MALWQESAEELLRVLIRLGAFRNVIAWRFDSDDIDLRLWPYEHRRRKLSTIGNYYEAKALADPTGRRMILIISDGVGKAWWSGRMAVSLEQLSRQSHVAVINPLPSRMWHRSGIRAMPMHQRVSGFRNTSVLRHLPTPWSPTVNGRWLSVWHLSEDDLHSLASLLASSDQTGRVGMSMPVQGLPEAPETDLTTSLSSSDQVRRFRVEASSSAFALAGRLAAVPLCIPVMRLVQEATLPGTGTDELAEIFLSGLLVRTTPRVHNEDPDIVVYDFVDEVRDQLLASLTRTEALTSLDVIAQVSDHVARLFGGTLNFRLLAERDGGAHALPPQARPFATVAVSVLRSLGPAYSDLADQIGSRLEHEPTPRFRLVRDSQFPGLTPSLMIVQVDGPAHLGGDGTILADLLADRIATDPEIRPDIIVACEDLVSSATSAEVARSAAFFGRLLQRFELTPQQLVLAPAPLGWQNWGQYEYARAIVGRSITSLLEDTLGCRNAEQVSWRRVDLPEHRVSMVVLDSTRAAAATMAQSPRGALGEQQLAWLASQSSRTDDEGWLRVGLMHHDPATRLQDSRAFRALVEPNLDLVLHGWGPSASSITPASGFPGSPVVPDPSSGYVIYGITGGQVALRGQRVVASPAIDPSYSSVIVNSWHPQGSLSQLTVPAALEVRNAVARFTTNTEPRPVFERSPDSLKGGIRYSWILH